MTDALRDGWSIPQVNVPGKDLVQSRLHPNRDRFPLYIPKMHTYDKKGISSTSDLLNRLRANAEDRVKPHTISLLTRLIQKDLPPEDSIAKGCDADHSTSKLSALVHQDFIRRYLTTDTPERGLLVYHGLGSGKTATSIAVIEANRSKKRIIVMVPASLQDNYELEIIKLGPVLFGRGTASLVPYEWYFHRIDPERYADIAEDTNIPVSVIEANGGIFRIVDPSETDEGTKWDEMRPEVREKLGKQITEMLLSQIEFIRYNGLSYSAAYALDLDNAIVVIDEVHNISRMVRNKKEGIGRILYQKIRNAQNSKIVALSGTPLVNTPFEVAILANMIHGISRMNRVPFSHSRSGDSGSDISIINELYSDPIIRYASIVPSEKAGGGSELLLLRHAIGFESIYSGSKYVGLIRTNRDFTLEKDWLASLNRRLSDKGITLDPTKASITDMLWFPENEDTFMKMYTDDREVGTDGYIKHREQLLRRLMLVSFYRGADPIKYPRTRDIQVIRTEMNDSQFEEYARARYEEIRMSSKSKSNSNAGGGGGGGGGGGDEDVFTGRYRTRQLCSVYFPSGRPTRDVVKRELEMRGVIGEDAIQEEYNRRLTIVINNLQSIPDLRTKIAQYSPKYKKVIDILNDTDGLAMIYSSFLRMEGLETFGVFLQSDGYVPFEIVMDTDGKSPRIKGIISESEEERERFLRSGGKRFMVFSGAIDKDLRAYLIRIYRGDFAGLPKSLLDDLRTIMGASYTEDSTANLRGGVCRILMITGAGAEGLNLKGVRQVHVLEPYWNQARLEQVFGRAVRVCSHADLDESERVVERYLHICGFPRETFQEMISRGDNRFLEAKDNGNSTDEYLEKLSKKKSIINQEFLNLMKRAAVDCTLHAEQNGLSLTECMIMPSIAGTNIDKRIGISPDYRDDADENDYREELRDTIIVEIGRCVLRDPDTKSEIEMGSRVVAVDYRTMNAYDPDMIVIRKLNKIGHVEIEGEGTEAVVTLVIEQDPVADVEDGESDEGDAPPDASHSGGGGGVGDMYGRLVGGISKGTRFQIATDEELRDVVGEYKEFMSDLPEEDKERESTRIIEGYVRELTPMMFPSDYKRAKVFVLVMGHPGSGKTHFSQEMLDRIIKVKNPNKVYPHITRDDNGKIISIPMVNEDITGEVLSYDNYARIGVDEILVYMREYQSRLVVKDEGIVKKIDPRVIGDRTLRGIANRISYELLKDAIEEELPIIYETTFANPKNVINNIVKLAIENGYISKVHEGEGRAIGAAAASSSGGGIEVLKDSLIVNRNGKVVSTNEGTIAYPYSGQMIVLNFFNRNRSLTKQRVKERFEREGRYLKIDGGGFSVDSLWVEHKNKRDKNEYRNIVTGKGKSRYKLDIPVDLYLEIDTTDPDDAKIDYKNANVNIGFIRGEDMGELSTETLIQS